MTIDNRVVTLVDTPGFDDTFKQDVDVLQEVATWLGVTYESTQRLSGIIYLQPITRTRMTGSMVENLKVFEQLVGQDTFIGVVLVTTMWDLLLSDTSVGREREDTLKEGFWAPFIEKGSVTARSYGDRRSAVEIVERIAFDQRNSSNLPLAIQREMVDEHKVLAVTAAREVLHQSLLEVRQKCTAVLAKSRTDAQAKLSQTAKDPQTELDSLRAEQAHLKEALAAAKAEMANRIHEYWDRRFKTLINSVSQVRTHSTTSLPPSYEESMHASGLRGWFSWFSKILGSASSALSRETKFRINALRRLLRPQIPDGYTRFEWTCVCTLA